MSEFGYMAHQQRMLHTPDIHKRKGIFSVACLNVWISLYVPPTKMLHPTALEDIKKAEKDKFSKKNEETSMAD